MVLAPSLSSAAQGSRAGADWRSADGVRTVLDSLRPGVTVRFSYGDSPTSDSIRLGGRSVSITYGQGSIVLPTTLELPNATLSPTLGYAAWLQGGVVEVAESG